ncbi:glyoxalase [Actinorhabdospora filicis]|uniref:Glyoxalase n=1 Tax=Actinorhabdospora filicis TaxID=1785913 RepID=A0A9W6SKA8_9ACTN|nr:VOC family protein [Actinorhabdospora filicis]GLZ77266.1 glyoxalase [Actinorhabdospora filicis]
MALTRMDNIGIIVADLDTVVAFFTALGMELEGKAVIEGEWAASLVGLDYQSVDVAMMRTPDGHGRVELASYRTPEAVPGVPRDAGANTLGIRRIMFTVEDIHADIARLKEHGAELMGEVVRYEDSYLLCYLRGPEGIMVALAQELG